MAAPAIADRVKAQLEGDYPASRLAWVDSVSWSGPQQIPLTQIDRTAGAADWQAAEADKLKVQAFRKRLAGRGWWKPAVCLRLPGQPRLFLLDGHRRALAAMQLGIPVQAYVGTAKTAAGPWQDFHSHQLASDAAAVELSAQTGRLAVTPAPAGKPGGPGLWRVKGMMLPPYFENIRNALIRSGHTPEAAYRITWGAIRRWARGGGKVHPEVVAAAQAALASLAAKSAIAHSHANEGGDAVELAAPDLDAIALAFSEALHPRVPAGGAGGGEFGSKAAGPAKQPAKGQQARQQKPGIGAGRKAALAKQAASLHARAKADRMQAAELESQLQTLNAAIKVKVQASAKAKTAAKTAAAKAGTAKKAAKVTKATNKAKAGKKATAKKASLPHMRVRRIVLRSKIHDLRSQARALDKQAAAIKLAGDGGRFLELAFAEALAERVPSGSRDGGQFAHPAAVLTRHDTPEQRAKAVNALDPAHRAAVRTSTLPPPGFEWSVHDRLAPAKP